DRGQAVEELPHPGAPERDAHADGHAVPQLEGGDRLARAADAGRLPGERGELLGGGVEHVRVLLRVADAHVERDLLEARDLHLRLVAEALAQSGSDLLLVALLQPRRNLCLGRGFHYSISLPDFLATRTRLPPSRLTPTRVGSRDSGSTSITFETWIGPSISTMPPISWARWVSRRVR